ncbi:uncharacterized protein [Diadema antillarum]|uniref:uncharacterized protein n=1 Tax=Diadema antillarum TaxID=105358 RepID=UPI003A8BA4BF
MTTTTMTTLRQTDFLPSKFTGDRLDRDECTAHMLSFEDYLDAHDIDQSINDNLPTILRTFKQTLAGQARLWIDSITQKMYDDLKTSFRRQFSPAKSSYARVTDFNTMTMTDRESVETFLQRLRQTATHIDYGETQIRDRLLNSLTPDCRAVVMSALTMTQTSDQIAAKAQLFLDLCSDKTQTKEVTFATQGDLDRLTEEISSLKMTRHDDKVNPDNRYSRHSRPPTRHHSTSRTRSTSRDRPPDTSRERDTHRHDRTYRTDRSNSRGRD